MNRVRDEKEGEGWGGEGSGGVLEGKREREGMVGKREGQ